MNMSNVSTTKAGWLMALMLWRDRPRDKPLVVRDGDATPSCTHCRASCRRRCPNSSREGPPMAELLLAMVVGWGSRHRARFDRPPTPPCRARARRPPAPCTCGSPWTVPPTPCAHGRLRRPHERAAPPTCSSPAQGVHPAVGTEDRRRASRTTRRPRTPTTPVLHPPPSCAPEKCSPNGLCRDFKHRPRGSRSRELESERHRPPRTPAAARASAFGRRGRSPCSCSNRSSPAARRSAVPPSTRRTPGERLGNDSRECAGGQRDPEEVNQW